MDAIIDIILLVLVGVVPAVFKAVGNKLEKAGKTERAGKFKKLAEAMTDDEKSVFDEIETPVPDSMMEKRRRQVYGPDDSPVEPVLMNPDPVSVPVTAVDRIDMVDYINKSEPVVKRKKTILQEDEQKKETERIDPKKLVIYSEIMKPKF